MLGVLVVDGNDGLVGHRGEGGVHAQHLFHQVVHRRAVTQLENVRRFADTLSVEGEEQNVDFQGRLRQDLLPEL